MALIKPASCQGCPLAPLSDGFMRAVIAKDGYGVALLGEALGEKEVEPGLPFQGPAGFRLTRLIEWAGLDRNRFSIFNSAFCRPPDNALEGMWYERDATSHCRDHHWAHLARQHKVIVPLGNVAMASLGLRKGILDRRGYVYSTPYGLAIPTVHPLYIQRGQSRWSAPFIHDIQKAVELAEAGYPPQVTEYVFDPLPVEGWEWAQVYLLELAQNPDLLLAYDIETLYQDEDEEEIDEEDASWDIIRISFSYRGLSAITLPWVPEHYATIRALLGSAGAKIGWNSKRFDDPRIRARGFEINGLLHDGMIAWHILHSDLPKGLGFVATFTCPWQHEWKSMSGSHPQLYSCIDADVQWRSMDVIVRELRATGLWRVYERDVLDLEPVLVHMSTVGMPIDGGVRADRAGKLAERSGDVLCALEAAFPLPTRAIAHVYKETPKEVEGLLSRPGVREVPRCSVCGIEKPTKPHFKRYVRKVNPCADGEVVRKEEPVTEYYRLSDFKPSREQLIRYQQFLGRFIPTTWDKKEKKRKISMNEKAIKELIGKYPDDKTYPLVLQYRTLSKIAGTYIGYPA